MKRLPAIYHVDSRIDAVAIIDGEWREDFWRRHKCPSCGVLGVPSLSKHSPIPFVEMPDCMLAATSLPATVVHHFFWQEIARLLPPHICWNAVDADANNPLPFVVLSIARSFRVQSRVEGCAPTTCTICGEIKYLRGRESFVLLTEMPKYDVCMSTGSHLLARYRVGKELLAHFRKYIHLEPFAVE